MRGDQTGGEPRGGGTCSPLPKSRAHRQFEPVPCAGRPQARSGCDQRRQRRVSRQVSGDGDGIGGEIEHAPQPRDDRRERREFGKADRRAQRIALAGPHRDGPLQIVELDGPRISLAGDRFHAGNGALR